MKDELSQTTTLVFCCVLASHAVPLAAAPTAPNFQTEFKRLKHGAKIRNGISEKRGGSRLHNSSLNDHLEGPAKPG